MQILTVGHSNHTIEEFISLLQQHQVTAIGDVRSHPHSRFLPHFNRENLKQALAEKGIKYVFLGRELGARPENPDCYVEGKAMYEKIAATDLFHQGLQKVLDGVQKHRIALMCAEKDPMTCHRAILVCHHLLSLPNCHLTINHILDNGQLESHSHLEERMLAKHGFTEPVQLSLWSDPQSLTLTTQESLERAYQLQGNAIAYVEKETSVS